MKQIITRKLHKMHRKLPAKIQRKAEHRFDQLLADPHNFRRLRRRATDNRTRWITDIGNYRAVGDEKDKVIFWHWIGGHEAYNKIV